MKTTLWTRAEAERARPLLERLAEDVRIALTAVDQAARVVCDRRREFDEAKPIEARTLWIDLVRADETLAAALEQLHQVVKEAESLNARVDFDREGELSLAGADEHGRVVYWASEEHGCHPEPVHELEERPHEERPESAPALPGGHAS